jgi:uncharacterized membrane protein YfcA
VTVTDAVLVFVAGLAAGVINSVAGGGTLLSFPLLVWIGRDPIVANATNAIALWPGSLAAAYGFRRELKQAPRLLALLLPPAAVGAALGGFLLLRTPERVFASLVPFLILGATILLALQRPLARRIGAAQPHTASGGAAAVLVLAQLVVSIYGGYFGAAMGILMLAALGLFGVADIHERNGLKNVTSMVINGVAGLYFAASGAIHWVDAAVLAAGAVVGGTAGAALGRKLGRRAVEVIVVVIGVLAAGSLLLRR